MYFAEEMRSKGNFCTETAEVRRIYSNWVRRWSSTDTRSSTSVWSMKAAAWATGSMLIQVNPRDEMYASIIGMPLGILWAVYERKIDSYFEICYLRKEIVAILAFVILFIGRLVLSVAGFDNQLLQSVLRNIITIAFIVPLVGVLKNVRIKECQ